MYNECTLACVWLFQGLSEMCLTVRAWPKLDHATGHQATPAVVFIHIRLRYALGCFTKILNNARYLCFLYFCSFGEKKGKCLEHLQLINLKWYMCHMCFSFNQGNLLVDLATTAWPWCPLRELWWMGLTLLWNAFYGVVVEPHPI